MIDVPDGVTLRDPATTGRFFDARYHDNWHQAMYDAHPRAEPSAIHQDGRAPGTSSDLRLQEVADAPPIPADWSQADAHPSSLTHDAMRRHPDNMAICPTNHAFQRMERRDIAIPELQAARLEGERTPAWHNPDEIMRVEYVDPNTNIPVCYFAPFDDSAAIAEK